MRLGRPLAAASAVAAMTGASLIASPALANSSNRNSPSSSSSPAPSSTAEATPAPSSTAEATPAPGKTSEGSSFKITQEKTFVSASTNTSFTVSGTGCTGKQATVGIALYAPDGTVSDVVKTNAASDGSWTSDLDLAALIKSIGSSAATTTDGWTIGAGCMTYGGKTETAQVTTQQQTKIYFDDTRISGSYEVSARTESESQTFTFNAQGFYASEKVTVLLRSKSDSSISYTLGELTVDANGNLTGNLPAPTDAPDGEYLLVLTGSHHSETATSQTVTTVSNHTFTVESTENNGGGDKQANGGGGDKTATEQQNAEQKASEQNAEQKASEQNAEQKASEQKATEQKASEQKASEQKATEQKASEQKATEQQNAEQKATEQQNAEQKATEQKASENNGGGNKTVTEQQKASENNGGGNNGGSNSNANASENKGGTDQKVNDLNSNAKESSSDNRAGGETTKDSDRSLAHTGANGLIFGGIAVFLAVAGGAALLLRRRNKA